LLTLTLLGIIFAAPITKIIAWGFSSDTYKLTATIELTRILFPYLLFACLAALMLGVLNSMKVFFLPAVAPALLSVSEIIYVTLFIFVFTLNEDVQIKGLALSVLAGGFGQYVLQQIAVIKNGMPLRFSTDFRHPGLKNIFYLMLPSMIGFSVDQVNSFVDTICASFISEGSITALYYSNRLMQLPLALFGIATATVSLPHMAESIVQNNLSEMKNTLNFSIRMVIFSLVPATVGLAMLAEPIVRVLFERGSFDKTATAFTSSALIFYCWGLVAFSTTKIIAAAFYSMKNTKIPVRTAVISMLVNVILNVILMKPMGVGGLALATTISSWLNTTILLVSLRNKIGLLGIRKIINSSIKILISTGVMAAGVHFTHITLSVYNETISVFMSIIIGIFLYFFASRHLKSEELKPIISMLRRESPSDE
ncbi:MAG: murein biosynthesis integral membrane protein MurJ, partial [Elusimicrobiota bacterium]